MLLLHHIEQSMQAKRKVIRPATKSQIEKEDEDLGTCRILVVLALLVLLLFLIRHLRHLPLPSSSGAGRDRKLMRRSTECCRLGREGVGRPGVEWQRAEAVQVAMNERQLLPTTGVRKWCSPAAPP